MSNPKESAPTKKSFPFLLVMVITSIVLAIVLIIALATSSNSVEEQNQSNLFNTSNGSQASADTNEQFIQQNKETVPCSRQTYYYYNAGMQYNFVYNSCNWQVIDNVSVVPNVSLPEVMALQIKHKTQAISGYFYTQITPTAANSVNSSYCTGYDKTYEARTLKGNNGKDFFGLYRVIPVGKNFYVWSSKKQVSDNRQSECLFANGVFDFKFVQDKQVTSQSVFAFSSSIPDAQSFTSELKELDEMLLSLETR